MRHRAEYKKREYANDSKQILFLGIGKNGATNLVYIFPIKKTQVLVLRSSFR